MRNSVANICQVRVAPSVLAADLARLGEHVAEVERCSADRIHDDVMDGHFVPNISMGPMVVETLRWVTRLPLEAHLMTADSDKLLGEVAKAGAGVLVAGTAICGGRQRRGHSRGMASGRDSTAH